MESLVLALFIASCVSRTRSGRALKPLNSRSRRPSGFSGVCAHQLRMMEDETGQGMRFMEDTGDSEAAKLMGSSHFV